MRPTCIVTDSSAQFTKSVFPGKDLVYTIPLSVDINNQIHSNHDEELLSTLPQSADDRLNPHLLTPSVKEFQSLFTSLAETYHDILAIFHSSSLSQTFLKAQAAASEFRGGLSIQLVDSQTISVGLGILVEAAAEAVARGLPVLEIDRLVRNTSSRIYSVLCTPGVSYLLYNGFVDRGQAAMAEMLGLYPIFAIEEGALSSLEKVRNSRQVMDFFIEFLDEFDALQHIALVQGTNLQPADIQAFQEHAADNFSRTPLTMHKINMPLTALAGPHAMALFVVEAEPKFR